MGFAAGAILVGIAGAPPSPVPLASLPCAPPPASAVLLASFASPAAAAGTEETGQSARGTTIRGTILIGEGNCTITIVGGDVTSCEGLELVVAAVRDPEWTLDEEPVGSGLTLTLPPLPAGTYTLAASCGSCRDEVGLTVFPAASCDFVPDITALYSDDATENTVGIFQGIHPTPVLSSSFEERKLLMRPVTLDVEISGLARRATGDLILTLEGPSLDLYSADGAAIALPDTFRLASLPCTVYLNVETAGDRWLAATCHLPDLGATGSDTVRVRAGPFPGLAGEALPSYPHFAFVQAINDDQIVQTAIDPTRHVERVGLPYRVYVVDHKTPSQWVQDRTLIDVSGGYETAVVTPGSITDNTVNVWTAGLQGGTVGRGYDVIYDFGLDGALDPGDLIDGFDDREPGITVMPDLTLLGPHAVREVMNVAGEWLQQDIYYPSDIDTLGKLPLVTISHGYGHLYTWYDYLGEHLASHGYVVMSHRNNIGPGIEAASQTTIENIDYFVGHQDTIAAGVLAGHVDGNRIVSIGHSRGGEGVLRAYTRVFEGDYIPDYYGAEDIVALSSIAPVVYLTPAESNPHEVNYHLIWGAADGDVSGSPACAVCQSFRHAELSQGNTIVTYIQGADHEDFNCCGPDDGQGPDQIGRAETQRVAKGYYLALAELYTRDNRAMKDYFARMYPDFHPSGIAPHVVSSNQYRDGIAAESEIIDDYQSNSSAFVSSSGGAVQFNVSHLFEGQLDGDADFTWTAGDPMNGMTQAEGTPDTDGVVFDWTTGEQRFYELEVVEPLRDFTDNAYLSFRACQGTRHPETVALGGGLSFTVTLRDGHGVTSSINFGVFGGLTEPYQRTGAGAGAGWQNEFHTIRIRIADFENDGSGIDLRDVRAVRFEFGSDFGSERGRIGLDDILLTRS
jgi:hypothetical protein